MTSWVPKNIYPILFICFVSVLPFHNCLGQLNSDRPLVFNNIGKDDGLPHNFINATVEDEHGFIWIGTNDGLCRFDSHQKFKTFKASDVNYPSGLQSSFIFDLFLGTDNILYIGTRQGGLTIYDIENDTWETYVHDKNDPNSISNDEILTILEDSKGRIWVGTENGLNLFDKENKTFKQYLPDNSQEGTLKAKAVLSVTEDKNGWVWVGTWDGGLYLLDVDDSSQDIFFRHFNPAGESRRNSIWRIYQDSYENYWLGSHTDGLFLMTLPEDAQLDDYNWEPQFQRYIYRSENKQSLPANFISDIAADDEGNLWLASVSGVAILSKNSISKKFGLDERPDLSFFKNIYDSTIKTSLPDNNITHLYKDKSGVMWLSTRTGLSRYNPLSNQIEDFKLFDINYGLPNSQNHYVDLEGICWIAAGENGLFHYDKNSQEYYQFENSKIQSHEFISAIYSKDHKHIYIATNTALLAYNPTTKVIREYKFEKNAPIDVRRSLVINILQDTDSLLWLGTENGMMRLDLMTEKFEYFKHNRQDLNSLVDNSVTQIFINKQNEMWISTYNGLSKVERIGKEVKFENFKASKEIGKLKSNKITSMVDIDSILILGTESGLLGYHYEKDIFLEVSDKNEKNNVYSLIAVPDGDIWGTGVTSIFKFDPVTKQVLNFDYNEGASSSIYLHKSAFLSQDTLLHFGNMSGFTLVDPLSFKTNTTPPNISITEVEVFDPNGRKQMNVIHQKGLEISSDHYSIEIHFAALNYNRPDKTKYAYMLEGFDQDWKFLHKTIPATYTNLDHGNYKFRVKASNEVGIWNENGISFPIVIRPSLLETNLAKLLLLLLSLLLIAAVVMYYIKRIKRRNSELRTYNRNLNREIKRREAIELALQKSNLELTRSNKELEQFAYIASHDLQEPLRITGSFIDLLGKRYESVLDENAFKYIDFAKGGVSRMGLLIKNLLTFSKVGGTVLNFQSVSTEEIVKEKLLDLSGLINERNAEIKLGKLPEIVCEKNQIAMLFYNLINNAIKFNKSVNPIVEVSMHDVQDPGFHSFYVKDNGIGIDPIHKTKIFEIFKRLHDKDEYEGTGIGLALCKKIVARHGGSIWVDSTLGEGTTFNFTLSIKPKKIKEEYTPEEYHDPVLSPD